MTYELPPRKRNAPTGSQFMARVGKIYGSDYEKKVVLEILSGNVPDFMSPENWREITMKGKVDGMEVEIRLKVCPDYLAIGSNEDYVRVPLSPVTLQRLADALGWALPTVKVVDEIYRIAGRENSLVRLIDGQMVSQDLKKKVRPPRSNKDVLLANIWNSPRYRSYISRFMTTSEFALRQSKMADREKKGMPKHALVCGNKKDVVVHKVPDEQRYKRRLIQYRPFHPQGLDYGAHPQTHIDYSLGARFVHQNVTVTIRGKKTVEIPATYEGIIKDKKTDMYKILSEARFDISQVYRKPLPHVTLRTVPVEKPKEKPRKRAKLRMV